MVNASLNWASIVGIVLAVGGALLYFMRSFKPALARDYDVFFAAIGLLCGGILFFQGWRLDPILQFGQFLLAGTTVFFAYESVRLRGVTTEQARRSSFFEDEEPLPRGRGGLGPSRDWDNEPERFEDPVPVRRRFRSYDEPEDDFYRPRRSSRAAIPERAASRGAEPEDWSPPRRGGDRPDSRESADRDPAVPRYGASPSSQEPEFGSRRRQREAGPEARRGSRPTPSSEAMPRSSRRPEAASGGSEVPSGSRTAASPGVPQGSPIPRSSRSASGSDVRDADFTPVRGADSRPETPRRPEGSAAGSSPLGSRPAPARDNSSRFDD
ncbi:MAG: Ycf66 family protein [Synechococcaceae cyanobacterium]|nr:Ycf66 family protein [Synechococcaceae cyanobacterium]